MASRTDNDDEYEHRSFERRLVELEKSEIWARTQIDAITERFESERSTHARINAAQDRDIANNKKDIADLKYVIFERIDFKIDAVEKGNEEKVKSINAQISKVNEQITSLAGKILVATGFLAGLQFFLQVILPHLLKKGGM